MVKTVERAVNDRMMDLSEMGDPLEQLNACIKWEEFRSDLKIVYEKERKSNAGAKPYDVVLMFKILILQQIYNLSDEGIEYQITDRFSFMRFLRLGLTDRIPDAKTVWYFRERLKEHELMEILFNRFHEQLAERGYVARKGQMVDATFVEAPKQRNNREENGLIKAGAVPVEWGKNPDKLAQKDIDARWTKKNNETHYGYKNHVNVDEQNKLIQTYAVTAASVHDSQIFEELLDHSEDEAGQKRPVYADSAYRSEATEKQLASDHIPSQVHEKGSRGHPLTEEQKASNKTKSKTRARVEHVFGAQSGMMGGHLVRVIGLARAEIKIGMMNLAYNMKRLGQLIKRDLIEKSAILSSCGVVAPEMG